LTEIGPNGFDVLQIKFSANPGIPPKPLKDVASSGEISRVMLAMKTILAEADSIPVLIFDELDANIGGETAGKVGHELKKLAEKKQVICISHSPQVASCGDKHFLVYKKTNNNMTQSTIHELNHEERIVELSRMLGGGEAAKQYALTMLT